MGLYDTFYIEKDGKLFDVQTKQLDCTLDSWRVGETVVYPSPYAGENEMNRILVEDLYNDHEWVGIVIYEGIFIDYILTSSKQSATDQAEILLSIYKENPNRLNESLTSVLIDKERQLNRLRSNISGALCRLRQIEDYLGGDTSMFDRNSKLTLLQSLFNDYVPEELKGNDVPEEHRLRFLLELLASDIAKNLWC